MHVISEEIPLSTSGFRNNIIIILKKKKTDIHLIKTERKKDCICNSIMSIYQCSARSSPPGRHIDNNSLLPCNHQRDEVTQHICYAFYICINNSIKLFFRNLPYLVVSIDGTCIVYWNSSYISPTYAPIQNKCQATTEKENVG